jgi:hypothetical protein
MLVGASWYIHDGHDGLEKVFIPGGMVDSLDSAVAAVNIAYPPPLVWAHITIMW